jgi:CRP-like cAMP-binding protein
MPVDRTVIIRHELIKALSQSPLLVELGQNGPYVRELRKLLEHAQVMTFSRRRVIMEQGSRSDYLYLLVSGEVEVLKGDHQLCILSQPGEVFGETGALTGQPRTATIRAVTEAVVLAVEAREIRAAGGEGNHAFQLVLTQALTRIIASRLDSTTDDLVDTRTELAGTQVELAASKKENARLGKQIEGLKGASGRFRGTRTKE